eukprot:COSAG01_NODE_10819_length_2074_cov_1.647089_3_plen_74_part_00
MLLYKVHLSTSTRVLHSAKVVNTMPPPTARPAGRYPQHRQRRREKESGVRGRNRETQSPPGLWATDKKSLCFY